MQSICSLCKQSFLRFANSHLSSLQSIYLARKQSSLRSEICLFGVKAVISLACKAFFGLQAVISSVCKESLQSANSHFFGRLQFISSVCKQSSLWRAKHLSSLPVVLSSVCKASLLSANSHIFGL